MKDLGIPVPCALTSLAKSKGARSRKEYYNRLIECETKASNILQNSQ